MAYRSNDDIPDPGDTNFPVDDKSIVKIFCSETISLGMEDSKVWQEHILQLLKNADKFNIPVVKLRLHQSFYKIKGETITLKSGLQLACPSHVGKIVINTYKEGREITENDFINILMFGVRSQQLEELQFRYCLLPYSFPGYSLSRMVRSRNVTVSWVTSFGSFELDLETGRWMSYLTGENLTRNDYHANVESQYRIHWRDTEFQKSRVEAARKARQQITSGRTT